VQADLRQKTPGVSGGSADLSLLIHQIELRQLRYVVAVAEDLHFNHLHLAAPSLSKQIKQLETLLGYPLFERRTRQVVLTKAGSAFVVEAREALNHVVLEEELASFFEVTTDRERELFSTFLLTGFREQEVAFLFWSDINLRLRTIRVTSKPHLGFSPKRWEEREIPIAVELARLLEKRPHLHSERFVFPSPTGNREHNMLLKCKAVAERAGLNSEKFDLKTFRSTYATRMLRSGFDVRTVQHWMGHKSLETTMRYLVPASDVHDRLDQVVVPSVAKNADPPRKSVQQEVAAVNRPLRRQN
jgi:integrase